MSEAIAADSGVQADGLQNSEIPVSDNVGAKPREEVKPERVKVSTRESVRQAIEQAAKPKEETKPAPEGETAEQKAERLRDEAGRFAKAEGKPEAKPEEGQPEAKPAEKVKVYADPPAHWLGEEKLNWKSVPHGVRQAILNDQQALNEARQQLQSYEKVMTPERRQQLAMAYGSDVQGLDAILQTVEFSNRDAEGFIKWFAQQRNIPLSKFAQVQEQPQVDPQAQQIQQLLNPVLQPVLGEISAVKKFMQEQEAAKQQQAVGVVQSFMADHTNHPYAKDVEQDMIVLLGSGKFTGTPEQKLKAAYEAAVWSNPTIRARLLAEQTRTAQVQQSQVADSKRALAASVTGAPGTAKPIPNGSYVKESPRDSVRRALEQAGRV